VIRTILSTPALLAFSAGLSITYSIDALAQQQGAAAADSLQEIVVTATKRETTVQSTPISITAVSGVDIEARGFVDFDTLAQSIPGVSMQTSGPGQTSYEMRGVAAIGGNSPTVGFYLDDTPLTGSDSSYSVIDPNLYDLNRIEVLRGPQGTLYGAGSMGGTIRVIPNAPDPKALDASAETIFSATEGGGFNHGVNAMLNVPLGSTAAVRIVGSESHTSGWIDRVVIANGGFPAETNDLQTRGNVAAAPVAADYKGSNAEKLTGARIALLWNPTDQLAIQPSYFHQELRQDGLSSIDSDPGTDAHYQPFDAPEPFSDRFDLSSLNAKYRFDAFDVVSTTSHWTRDWTLHQDGAEEFQWALSTPAAISPFYASQGGLGALTPTPSEFENTRQTSEELRLVSSGNSSLQWLLGYFYSDFSDTISLSILAPGATALFGTPNLYSNYQPTKIIQRSFFGEASYEFIPAWKATVGLRRYAYDTSVVLTQSGAIAAAGTTSSFAQNSGVNPKFGLSYQMDKDLLLYFTAAKGFRPGGGNFPVPTSGPVGDTCEAALQANAGTTSFVSAPSTFGPDGVWSYELGEKAAMFDNRVTLNSAGYFENWSGLQQSVGLSCGFAYTGNLSDAHIYGGETEVNVLLAQGLLLSANAAYTHATIVATANGTGIAAGSPVQNTPLWTSSTSLAYRRGIGAADLAFTARIENNYVDGHIDVTSQVNHLPPHDLTNLRVGLENDHWRAILFATNLFNQRALLSDTSQQINLTVPTFNRISVSQPLTFGIDLSYHLGH
jgi:outer membrane receptor protein involved in Fe transport